MLKYSPIGLLLILINVVLLGCAHQPGAEAGTITLEDAMAEVARGLNQLHDIRKDHPKDGLLPSEVTITFTITSDKSKTGHLYVEANASPTPTVQIGKIGADLQTVKEIKRGNTVTITMTNLLFASKESPIGSLITNIKSPSDLKVLWDTLDQIRKP